MNAQQPKPNNVNDSDHALNNVQPDCSAIQALIPDYAFGLTDEVETRWIETGLDHCADATAMLTDYRQMQRVLRADVPQIAPPPQLGLRLMATAANIVPAVQASVPTEPKNSAQPPANEPAKTIAAPNAQLLIPNITGMRPRLNRWPGLLAAAVVVLVLSNVYWLVRVNGINNELSLAKVSTPVAVATTAPALVVNTTSTLRWVHLPASEQNGKASAYLMWNAESKIGLLYVHDFPVLPNGQTYQLWLTRGAEHLSVGTFTVDQNGKGALLFSTQSIDQYTWARITTEPQSGSDVPDGTVVVVGQL